MSTKHLIYQEKSQSILDLVSWIYCTEIHDELLNSIKEAFGLFTKWLDSLGKN